MANKCRRCLQKKLQEPHHKVGIVPAGGRAHAMGLCCKCDRDIYGPQSREDKSDKQIAAQRKKAARRSANTLAG